MAALIEAPSAAFRDRRRAAVAGSGSQRGLDHATARREADGRWTLTLCFVPSAVARKSAIPPGIGSANVRIALAGGITETGLLVEAVEPPDPGEPTADRLAVRLAQSGSLPEPVPGEPLTYTVELVGVRDLDRFFAAAPFTLEPGLPAPLAPRRAAAGPRPAAAPAIDYLAKDYASLRQLMLERMALAIPAWRERNPSDYGIATLEVLAYAGDYLSYYQDAVGTEAYLATARRRISVRRHARLVDYRMNDGLNARAWLHVRVVGEADAGGDFTVELPRRTAVLTHVPDLGPAVAESSSPHLRAREPDVRLQVFETMAAASLLQSQNELRFYLWGAVELTLPAGATSAALAGHPTLAQGDVLIFEDLAAPADPETGLRPSHAVRLSAPPQPGHDRTLPEAPAITEISWFAEDALPSPLVVAAYRGGMQIPDLAVARGNIVPVDHGKTIWEELAPVPERGPYRPVLSQPDVTLRVPFDAALARCQPAAAAMQQDPLRALPAVVLYELPLDEADGEAQPSLATVTGRGRRWEARYDLLASGRFDRHFVAEIETGGRAHLRFGDGGDGRRPLPGSRFWAVYRVGTGPQGNVGPGSLRHVVVGGSADRQQVLLDAVAAVDNPLQGLGGTAPELLEQVRVLAPHAFHAQARCVTEEDFVRAARDEPGVLGAVARLRFTGSWETAFLYVQRTGGLALDADFERRLEARLAPRLVAGYGLAIAGASYVPVEIVLEIDLEHGVPAEPVRQALAALFSSRELPAGGRGYFYPDGFTFGQPLYLSEIVARSAALRGVARVETRRFQRWGQPARGELAAGRIDTGALEIVRVESRPGAPQLGSITFRMRPAR